MSNFSEISSFAKVKPALVQAESHPYNTEETSSDTAEKRVLASRAITVQATAVNGRKTLHAKTIKLFKTLARSTLKLQHRLF